MPFPQTSAFIVMYSGKKPLKRYKKQIPRSEITTIITFGLSADTSFICFLGSDDWVIEFRLVSFKLKLYRMIKLLKGKTDDSLTTQQQLELELLKLLSETERAS